MMIQIWKFVNFGAGNSYQWVRSMKNEFGNFLFSHENILKQNYTVIFISLSLINICQNFIGLYWCFSRFSIHCSYVDFQHKILNWSCKQGRKEGTGTMRFVYKFSLEVSHEKYLFWKFWKFFTKTPVLGSCFNKIARPVTALK